MLNLLLSLAFLALISIYPNAVLAHCDSLVGPKDEKIIIDAFQHTLEVHIQSKINQELADQYFFKKLLEFIRPAKEKFFQVSNHLEK